MSSACLTPLPPARTKFIEEPKSAGTGKEATTLRPNRNSGPAKARNHHRASERRRMGNKIPPFCARCAVQCAAYPLSLSPSISLWGKDQVPSYGRFRSELRRGPISGAYKAANKKGYARGDRKEKGPVVVNAALTVLRVAQEGWHSVCVCAYEVWCNSPSRPTRSISWFIFRSEFILFLLKDFPTVTGVFIGFTKRRGEHNCSLRGGGLLAALRSRSTSTRRHHGPWTENCIYTCCRSHRTRQHGTE